MDRDQRFFVVGLVVGAACLLLIVLLSVFVGQTSGFYGLPPHVNPMVR